MPDFDLTTSLYNSKIPRYMHGGIIRYIETHIPPGDFLSAIICNDLQEACARADDTNRHILYEYVQWFYCNAPGNCWGSPERYNQWVKKEI
jgi:hypothetical protein